MAFWDEFTGCMHGSGLPVPAEAVDDAGEALEFLEHLHTAAEAAGGVEITLAALEAAGFTALGGELAADAAAITVSFYAGACIGCLIAASGASIYDWLAQTPVSDQVREQVLVAANDAGIAPDTQNV